ncbi:MAG: hypothetical protein AB8C02_16620 [Halioglobus sp.]
MPIYKQSDTAFALVKSAACARCAFVVLALGLQACTTVQFLPSPDGDTDVSGSVPVQEVPELELNLDQPEPVECVRDESADYTFLEKGFSLLVADDQIEAVRYFQTYQRLEASPRADWESGIAIAYASMLPQSPFYDPQAARRSYNKLVNSKPEGVEVHERVLFMRDALAALVSLNRQIGTLQRDKAALEGDLRKREDALRRLRELTLGQKGSTP